jgi:hypothetical protein
MGFSKREQEWSLSVLTERQRTADALEQCTRLFAQKRALEERLARDRALTEQELAALRARCEQQNVRVAELELNLAKEHETIKALGQQRAPLDAVATAPLPAVAVDEATRPLRKRILQLNTSFEIMTGRIATLEELNGQLELQRKLLADQLARAQERTLWFEDEIHKLHAAQTHHAEEFEIERRSLKREVQYHKSRAEAARADGTTTAAGLPVGTPTRLTMQPPNTLQSPFTSTHVHSPAGTGFSTPNVRATSPLPSTETPSTAPGVGLLTSKRTSPFIRTPASPAGGTATSGLTAAVGGAPPSVVSGSLFTSSLTRSPLSAATRNFSSSASPTARFQTLSRFPQSPLSRSRSPATPKTAAPGAAPPTGGTSS